MAEQFEALNLIQEANKAVESDAQDPRLSMSAAQMAIVFSDGTKPDLLEDRIKKLPESSVGVDIVELLTEAEQRFLPAAKVIVGLIFEEADEHAHRKAYLMGQTVRRQLR